MLNKKQIGELSLSFIKDRGHRKSGENWSQHGVSRRGRYWYFARDDDANGSAPQAPGLGSILRANAESEGNVLETRHNIEP